MNLHMYIPISIYKQLAILSYKFSTPITMQKAFIVYVSILLGVTKHFLFYNTINAPVLQVHVLGFLL